MVWLFTYENGLNFCWFLLIFGFELANGDKNVKKRETSTIPNLRKHTCCARREKLIDAGHGISGEIIKIDIGECKSFCPRYFVDDPGDLSRPAIQKCLPNMYCRPKTAKLQRVSTIEGVRTVEVVDSCDCSASHVCRREFYSQILYAGTPYQVEIDVGACVGSCKKNSCKPSRNSSISVRGPNGYEVHRVIERCRCASGCHRMDHMETVLDFSGVELEKSMNIADAKPIVREINIGQCFGTCNNNATEICLLRDKTNPTNCLTGLLSGSQNCVPVKYKIQEYRTRRGAKRGIIQITQCACV